MSRGAAALAEYGELRSWARLDEVYRASLSAAPLVRGLLRDRERP